MRFLSLFLRDIRIEHTLFALPFAYVGAVMGARGIPTLAQLLWITLAVIGARTAAMAANRLLDRKLDAANPRTALRPTASGALPAAAMLVAIVAGILLTLVAALNLNPLCVALAVLLVVYERRLIGLAGDVFVLNDRVFRTNMAFSVGFLATTIAAYAAKP